MPVPLKGDIEMDNSREYSIIYADPPWKYERNVGSGIAENHYSTMSVTEICSLPVDVTLIVE